MPDPGSEWVMSWGVGGDSVTSCDVTEDPWGEGVGVNDDKTTVNVGVCVCA